MKIIAVTQKGPNKSENEDRIVVGKSIISEGTFLTEMTNGILAVADGVGGNNGGAVASHFVAKKLTCADVISSQTFSIINRDLLHISSECPQYHNMATTLSGLSISNGDAQLFSIGNTRVYLLQGRKYLKQLTNDDTTLHYLLTTGQLTDESANTFGRKNEITACFGGGSESLFRIKLSELDPLSSPVILTSDGIHDYISVDQMEDIFADQGLSVNACNSLISAARQAGSQDDASIIIGEM